MASTSELGHDIEALREKLKHFLTALRTATLTIKGADLIERGAPRGPRLGEAMEQTLLARLDGRLATKEDELAFALDLLGDPVRDFRWYQYWLGH